MEAHYYPLPSNCARGMRREVRGHLWGLFALVREIDRQFSGELAPQKEEAFECWISYFFGKMFAHPLPKDPSRLRGTLEGQMYSHISRLFHDERAKKYRDLGKALLHGRLRSKDVANIRRTSEHVEDAMACYEEAFKEAHRERVTFFEGGFESGKK